jgi:Dolichyl-phosphate-mannose-protein mannosyltransferase
MRVSSRSSTSVISALMLLGTGALLVLVVVLITGGFVIDAGPVHFSSRRPAGPLVILATAWMAAFVVGGRQAAADALASLNGHLDRHAPAIAIVIAASAAGTGVGFGTFAASAADASGYVSQSRLLAAARVSFDEPLARLLPWTNTTWAFSPLGYRPGHAPGEVVPTYPPGLPLTMAAARAIGGEWAPFFVVPLLGGLAVFWTYLLGARLHSRRAGLTAALLLATSPIFLFQLVQPMSDVPAVAWWTLALVLAFSPELGAPVAAGAAAGFALLARPNLLPLVAPLAVAVYRWPSPQPRRLLPFAAGLVPAAGALALLQWRLYGSPLASGHGAFRDFFAISNVWPNVRVYSAHLIRGETAALGLALIAIVVALATRRGVGEAPGRSLAPAANAAALFGGVILLCYLPYVVFRDWFYLRFFLPAFPLAFVVVGAVADRASSAFPPWARGLALLTALATVASVNLLAARREQAFSLRDYEGRYLAAGRYADAVLPREAVIFAVQESGSARYYARPVVRWDLLPVDLDTAVATLTAMRRRPVFLVEDWEAADLRMRFPLSQLARLDWPPRADIGTHADIHVFLFDPADRDQPGRVRTDRFR